MVVSCQIDSCVSTGQGVVPSAEELKNSGIHTGGTDGLEDGPIEWIQ